MPVYKTLPGFKCDIRGLKDFDKLPEEAKNYVIFIEKEIETPITMVSNGPRREEIIFRNIKV
jgi:adenylosuccinate synthase